MRYKRVLLSLCVLYQNEYTSALWGQIGAIIETISASNTHEQKAAVYSIKRFFLRNFESHNYTQIFSEVKQKIQKMTKKGVSFSDTPACVCKSLLLNDFQRYKIVYLEISESVFVQIPVLNITVLPSFFALACQSLACFPLLFSKP